MVAPLPDAVCHSVLIVDRSDESREVLRTALQRRGVRTIEAGLPEQGLEMAHRHQPDLVVLDLNDADDADAALHARYCQQSDNSPWSLVVLGNPTGGELMEDMSGSVCRRSHQVAKPYHYAPLIRTIERLLEKGVHSG